MSCTFGCALAMRVLQSDLYRQLDERERAECDEFVARWLENQHPKPRVLSPAAEADARAFGAGLDPVSLEQPSEVL